VISIQAAALELKKLGIALRVLKLLLLLRATQQLADREVDRSCRARGGYCQLNLLAWLAMDSLGEIIHIHVESTCTIHR
jgi:hypothetical protein